MSIADNIARVWERIAVAAERAGRKPEDLTLMAVSKTFPAEAIREAYASGLRLFGENRVQEFSSKANAVRDLPGAEWRLIGHLQSNKAGKAAELFSGIDSIDSIHLAQKLNRAAEEHDKKLAVLIEVNVGGEAQKTGVRPGSLELEELLQAAPALNNLEFRGLMTIPPLTEDPEGARPFFLSLRKLRDEIACRHLEAIGMGVLSMGMSHDFEIAVEEGSTCVRVGSAIFGERR